MKLYDAKAIARTLGITQRRVRQLKQDGIIKEYPNKSGLYELLPTIHAYIAYIKNGNPDTEESINYNVERAKLAKARRLNEEYELGVKEKTLHHSQDVKKVMVDMLFNFKSRLLSIPTKATPILASKKDKSEIHDILKEYIVEALNELSTYAQSFEVEDEVTDEVGN